MRNFQKGAALFAVSISLSACTYTGNLRKDFHQGTAAASKKLPARVGIMKEVRIKPVIFPAKMACDRRVEIDANDGLQAALHSEMAAIFSEAQLVDRTNDAPRDYDVSADFIVGEVNQNLTLSFRDSKSQRLAGVFSKTFDLPKRKCGFATVMTALTSFTWGIFSPTVRIATNKIGKRISRDTAVLMSQALKDISGEIYRNKGPRMSSARIQEAFTHGQATRMARGVRYGRNADGTFRVDPVFLGYGEDPKTAGGERLSKRASAPKPTTEVLNAAPVAVPVPERTQKKYVAPRTTDSPLNVDTPTYRQQQRPQDFAIVVGIEEYSDLPKADFAESDARAVVAHMEALGVPRRNIIHLSGAKASYTGIKKYLEAWLPRNVKPTSRVFFYFSGHGAPDVKTGEAYLVPWNGDPSFLKTTAYPLKQLYKNLNALNAREIIVVLDTCFSGAGGRSVLGQGLRPLITKVDLAKVPGGPITVLTAAAGNEVTSTLKDRGHGMFTYFFLKGLNGAAKNDNGRITAKSLYRYLKPKVQDEARRQNREQTPTVQYTTNVTLR